MKKYLSILFIIFLITPQLIFASWWNPFSWFENKEVTEITATSTVEVKTQTKFSWLNPMSWFTEESKSDKQENLPTPTGDDNPSTLEVETVKAEAEKYKLQAEQTRLEIEKLKQEKGIEIKEEIEIEYKDKPVVKTTQQTQDATLKIAKCQAERDLNQSTFILKVDETIKTVVAEIQGDNQVKINEQRKLYNDCVAEIKPADYEAKVEEQNNLFDKLDTLEEDIKNRTGGFLVTEAQRNRLLASESEAIWKQINSLIREFESIENKIENQCDYYIENIELLEDYTKQSIAEVKSQREDVISEAKQLDNTEYYECINE